MAALEQFFEFGEIKMLKGIGESTDFVRLFSTCLQARYLMSLKRSGNCLIDVMGFVLGLGTLDAFAATEIEMKSRLVKTNPRILLE